MYWPESRLRCARASTLRAVTRIPGRRTSRVSFLAKAPSTQRILLWLIHPRRKYTPRPLRSLCEYIPYLISRRGAEHAEVVNTRKFKNTWRSLRLGDRKIFRITFKNISDEMETNANCQTIFFKNLCALCAPARIIFFALAGNAGAAENMMF